MYNLNDVNNIKQFLMEASDGKRQVSGEAVSILNFYDSNDSATVNYIDAFYRNESHPTSYAVAAMMYTVNEYLYLAQLYIPFEANGFDDTIPFVIKRS